MRRDEKWGCSKQVVLDGVARQGAARIHFELIVDRAHMRVERMKANDELLSDMGGGQALGDEPQHLYFAFGQSSRIRGRHPLLGNRLRGANFDLWQPFRFGRGENLFWRHGTALCQRGCESLLAKPGTYLLCQMVIL